MRFVNPIVFVRDVRVATAFYRDVVGLAYTEIADALEITLATVKWRIYKAREEVQAALTREGIVVVSNVRRAATPAEPAS